MPQTSPAFPPGSMWGSLWRVSRSGRRQLGRSLLIWSALVSLSIAGSVLISVLAGSQDWERLLTWHLPIIIAALGAGMALTTTGVIYLFLRQPQRFRIAAAIRQERRYWYTPEWVYHLDHEWVYRTFYLAMTVIGLAVLSLTGLLF